MTYVIDKIKDFHFKTWHFGLLLAILLILTNIIDAMTINSVPQINQNNFVEITNRTFNDAVSEGINFVLFYEEDSNLCNKMEYNLHQLSNREKYKDFKFYKLDFSKYPDKYSDYHISGTPCILIYKNGKEVERIMGVVSTSNIEIICNRILNK